LLRKRLLAAEEGGAKAHVRVIGVVVAHFENALVPLQQPFEPA
jgi:hypothetical protein